MSDFDITLPCDILRAVALVVSSEETRYYLQGVSVEPDGATLHLVATDGHRLMIARVPEIIPGEKFIIPAEIIARALKGHKAPGIGFARRGGAYTLGDILFRPVDGSFPDWSRVMPDMAELGTLAQYDPAYLEGFRKAAVMLGDKLSKPQVHHCGHSPALVTFYGRSDIFGLCMPYRNADKRDPAELKAMVADMTRKARAAAPMAAE
jgi:hypothetical protein